jgi:(2R)-3-sulfolactate dehydrogenase (NADP+)
MLALMVEILVSALTGTALSFQIESFFSETGGPMRIGQVFLVIDPGALAGHEVYFERVETLIAAMLAEPGVRLPGERRHKNREASRQQGVEIPDRLYEELTTLSKV